MKSSTCAVDSVEEQAPQVRIEPFFVSIEERLREGPLLIFQKIILAEFENCPENVFVLRVFPQALYNQLLLPNFFLRG